MRARRRNQRRVRTVMLATAAIVGALAVGPSFSYQGGVDEQQPTVPRPSTTTIAPADDVLTTTAVPDAPTAATN